MKTNDAAEEAGLISGGDGVPGPVPDGNAGHLYSIQRLRSHLFTELESVLVSDN